MPKTYQRWSKQKVVQKIRARATKGRSLRHGDVKRDDPRLCDAGYRYFGSWPGAIEASGFRYDRILACKSRDRARVAEALKRYASQSGGLDWAGLDAFDPGLGQATHKRFGSIEKAAKALKLPYRPRVQGMTRREVSWHIRQRHAQDQSLQYRRVQEENQRLIRAALSHFGSWDAAVRSCGIDITLFKKIKYPNKDAVDRALRHWSREHGKLDCTSVKSTDATLLAAVLRHYGTMEDAARQLRLPFKARYKRRDKASVLAELRERKRRGQSMKCVDVRTADFNLYYAAVGHFGGWEGVLAAVGRKR